MAVPYEEIVCESRRPTLVLAGPGAGKTYLLGDRVRRLIESGVSSESITVLTFGKDASQNMRNKLLDPHKGFGLSYDQLPRVATLHSLGFGVVSDSPKAVGLRKGNLRVQSDSAVSELIFRDGALMSGLTESDAEQGHLCKGQGDCHPGEEDKCRVCHAYREIMAKCNCIDFDDQVLLACQILEGDTVALESQRRLSQHLLVDEYQDINAAQFRLIKLLSDASPSGLFVVGDDAQSIYGFRGASPDFILGFEQHFAGGWTAPLAYSRRCHEGILGKAQLVLESHYPSWTGPYELEYTVPKGDEPRVWQVPSEDAEAHWTARIARRAVSENKTVLILAPKSAFFPRLSRTLAQYGVPHDCSSSLLSGSVSHRLWVLSTLLEWVENPEDNFLTRLAIECAMNNGAAKVPGFAKDARCTPETIARRVAVETEIAGLWNVVTSRRSLLAALEAMPAPSDDLKGVREVLIGLREAFGRSKTQDKGDFARQLALASGSWTDPTLLTGDLLSIRRELQNASPMGFSSVQMLTFRKAKGLEADVVVMVGLEDDIVPGSDIAAEEQARMVYVGMTRAKDTLYMLHSFKRPRNVSFGKDIIGKTRSRYLDALGIESDYRRGTAKTT